MDVFTVMSVSGRGLCCINTKLENKDWNEDVEDCFGCDGFQNVFDSTHLNTYPHSLQKHQYRFSSVIFVEKDTKSIKRYYVQFVSLQSSQLSV